jgi:8-oxo-dGTP diphosphatase/2-hydroxy-dATP diphosphatase
VHVVAIPVLGEPVMQAVVTAPTAKLMNMVYVLRDGWVLIGLKKRGFGAGKWNGFGGKVEFGESVRDGAARELEEESGLRVAAADLKHVGTMHYYYDTKPNAIEAHVFTVAVGAEAEPVESEEMAPKWFTTGEVCAGLVDESLKMWADDKYWLPQLLTGDCAGQLQGTFHFRDHEGAGSEVIYKHEITTVPAAAERPAGGNGH